LLIRTQLYGLALAPGRVSLLLNTIVWYTVCGYDGCSTIVSR
jgi:hypothetical protein